MSLTPFRATQSPAPHVGSQGLVSREQQAPPKRSFSLWSREGTLADLRILPSSEGRLPLLATADFQGEYHSGQVSYSRTTFALSVALEPKELPLLTGMVGRTFKFLLEVPLQITEVEQLRQENQLLKERLDFLLSSMQELVTWNAQAG